MEQCGREFWVSQGRHFFMPLVKAMTKCDKLAFSFAAYLQMSLIRARIFEEFLCTGTWDVISVGRIACSKFCLLRLFSHRKKKKSLKIKFVRQQKKLVGLGRKEAMIPL